MDNLMEEGTCPVCLEMFTDPHILACSHNICLKCAEDILAAPEIPATSCRNTNNISPDRKNNEERLICCPLCRTGSTRGQLKPNLALRNIVDALRNCTIDKKPSGDGNENFICGICEINKASLGCAECLKAETLLLCAECSAARHKGKAAVHAVGSLGSVESKEKIPRCLSHGKKTGLFCEDDISLICAHCTFDGHQGHKIAPLASAVKKSGGMIDEYLGYIGKWKKEIQTAIVYVDKVVQREQQDKDNTRTRVVDHFTVVGKALKERERELLTKVSEYYEGPLLIRKDLTIQITMINNIQPAKENITGDYATMKYLCTLADLKKKREALPGLDRPYCELTMNTEDILSQILKTNFSVGEHSQVGDGSDGDFIVEGQVELNPSKVYNFREVTVKQNAMLTVSSNLPLIIYAYSLVVERDGAIDLSWNGHNGGKSIPVETNGIAFQGASPAGPGDKLAVPNMGGGGGGKGSGTYGSTGGGGGGYGTKGEDADPNCYEGSNNPGSKGGEVYGDKELTVLQLGAGGGAGHPYSKGTGGAGGTGGGALKIITRILSNAGYIGCNGAKGGEGLEYGSGGGGGSGGSIHIKVLQEFENSGDIVAKGGAGGQVTPTYRISSKGGNGGDGRIRIDILDTPGNRASALHNAIQPPAHVVYVA